MMIWMFIFAFQGVSDPSPWQVVFQSALDRLCETYAYEFHRTADGPLAQQYAEVRGRAAFERDQTGALVSARIDIADQANVIVRNRTVWKIDHEDRSVMRAPMLRNGTELFDESLLAPHFLFEELKAAAEKGTLSGMEKVDGRDCYAVTYAGASLNYTFYIDQQRAGLTRIQVGSEQFGPYKIELTLNPPASTDWVRFDLPDGYAVREFSGSGPVIGEPAPDFQLTTFTGQQISLNDLRGKVVLLDFWATWCRPCLKAMPHLQKLHETYGSRLAVLGLNHQESGDPRTFIRRKGFSYAFAPGDEIAPDFNVNGLPFLVVIDGDGVVREFFNGYYGQESDDQLDAVIESLLNP